MSKKAIIIGGVLLIILIGALFAWREFNRTVQQLGDVPADYAVDATALIGEYAGSEQNADKKYMNRILSVKGMVKKIEDSDTTSIVILGDTTDMSSVRCIMGNEHQQKAAALQRGHMVTIKGAITGYKKDETGLLGSDVELNRCVIAN